MEKKSKDEKTLFDGDDYLDNTNSYFNNTNSIG